MPGTHFSRSLEWEHTQYCDQHTCNQGKAGGCQGICDLIKMLLAEVRLGVEFSHQREGKAPRGGLCSSTQGPIPWALSDSVLLLTCLTSSAATHHVGLRNHEPTSGLQEASEISESPFPRLLVASPSQLL